MKQLYSIDQVREMDRKLIEEVGIPGIALMEIASKGLAEHLRNMATPQDVIVFACGAGNNGGDAFAAARWLHGWGFTVRLWKFGTRQGEALIMENACAQLGIPTVDSLEEATLLVDGLFGTGLNRAPEAEFAEAINEMNNHYAPIVSIDIPSGLLGDTGAIPGEVVYAETTVTIGAPKLCLYGEPAVEHAGRVVVVDIGFGAVEDQITPVAKILDKRELSTSFPQRHSAGHKRSSGHTLIIAGSTAMAGAAVLACLGALRVGSGLVTLVTCESAVPRLGSLPPEVMVIVRGHGDTVSEFTSEELHGFTAIGAGPGLGGGELLLDPLAQSLRAVWTESKLPVVFDADALPCTDGTSENPENRVITPHPGEAARLLNTTPVDVQGSRFTSAKELGKNAVALLKGRNTVIASGDLPMVLNTTNSTVLSTGGSGDVLLGMVTGLCARGLSCFEATKLAVHLHGRAAQLLESIRPDGWTASQIADMVPNAIAELNET